MLRAIREISPRWVVGENVRGLTNWNGGVVFDEVQSDLEAEGYEVLPFLLPACAVNAPHRRDRIWFVAKNTRCNGRIQREPDQKRAEVRQQRDIGTGDSDRVCEQKDAGAAAHTKGNGDRGGLYRMAEADGGKREPEEHGKDHTESGNDGCQWIDPHPDSYGRNGGHGEHEKHTGQRWVDAQRDPEPMGGDVANTNGIIGREGRMYEARPETAKRHFGPCDALRDGPTYWQNFPTVAPVRFRNDGIPYKLFRYIKQDFYATISEEHRIKNLPEMWDRISQTEVWEKVRGLYSLGSKDILFQTMQLYQTGSNYQGKLSPFCEKVSEPIMRHLSKYGKFGSSPQGQELEKQRFIKFGNTLPFLPHEVALAAGRFETQLSKFETWHRKESIKAAGNAIVPQVALEIFKAIQQYENNAIPNQ